MKKAPTKLYAIIDLTHGNDVRTFTDKISRDHIASQASDLGWKIRKAIYILQEKK